MTEASVHDRGKTAYAACESECCSVLMLLHLLHLLSEVLHQCQEWMRADGAIPHHASSNHRAMTTPKQLWPESV